MRRTATIAVGTGIAIAVFGGGLALAFDGGGTSPGKAIQTASPAAPADAPSAAPSEPAATPSKPAATPSEQVATPSAAASPAPTQVGRAEAERIALRAVPGGRAESIEREWEHGRLVWDVDVISGNVEHKVQVDARTGEIVRNRAEHGDGRR